MEKEENPMLVVRENNQSFLPNCLRIFYCLSIEKSINGYGTQIGFI